MLLLKMSNSNALWNCNKRKKNRNHPIYRTQAPNPRQKGVCERERSLGFPEASFDYEPLS